MHVCACVCVKHFDTLLFDLSDAGEAMLPMHNEQLRGEQYIASCNKRKLVLGICKQTKMWGYTAMHVHC